LDLHAERRTARVAAPAAACLALASCLHGASLAEVVGEKTREQLRADFRHEVELFVANQQPGGAPDAPGLARSADGLFTSFGVDHAFSGKPGDLVLWLTPSLETGLNRLALVLRDSVKGRVAYDVGYLLESPNAPARFDPKTNVLTLPHAAVEDLYAEEPSVLRELVHVRTWATLRSGWPTPYQGYLRGGPFAPEALFLDEMNADAAEVRYAAHELSALLGQELDPASPVARSDLAGILRARMSGQKLDVPPSRLEKIWDRLVSRILLGGWHSYPALEALEPVARAAADPSRVQYEETPDGICAAVRASVTLAGRPQEVFGLLYLPSSQGPSDPKNPQILARQAASALEAARLHAEQFTRARTVALAIAGEVSPERKLEILLDPKALAGDL
jgi:hypothetical protein